MSRRHTRISSSRHATFLLPLLVGIAPMACGGGGDGAPQPPPLNPESSSYAIHFRVLHDGQTTEVSAPPAVSRWTPGKTSAGESSSALHVAAAGNPPPPSAPTVSSGLALLWGAAVECGVSVPTDSANLPPHTSVIGHYKPYQSAVVPPWFNGAYYVLNSPPQTCDAVLEDEETMLCIADKLAEVADTVAGVTWLNPSIVAPPSNLGIPQGVWKIPAQSSKDKFIVRDLAIQTLAQIARLSSETFTAPSTPNPLSCARLYAATSDPSVAGADANVVFGEPPGTSPDYPASSFKIGDFHAAELASDRLTFETHALRAGERLLHDLITDSIDDDKAQAEQKRSSAFDFANGNAQQWGSLDSDDHFYGSMLHVARVTSGRWDDNGCAPVVSSPNDLFGQDHDARTDDAPLTSSSQLAAVRFVEKSGLVLSRATLDATTDDGLRALLVQAIIADRASRNGITPTDMPESNADLTTQINALDGADVRFAFQRNVRTYRLLSNQGPDPDISDPSKFGLQVNPAFTPTGGVMLLGGLTRTRLASDPASRMGALSSNAQCPEPAGASALASADNVYTNATSIPLANRAPLSVYQDTTSIAQSLLRRLVVVDAEYEATPALAGLARDQGADTVSKGAIAEISSWAGAPRVVTTATGDGAPSTLHLDITGVSPEDWGIGADNVIDGHLILAYGPPWVADCATGKRADCPAGFAAKYTIPLSGTFAAPTLAERRFGGDTRMSAHIDVDSTVLSSVITAYSDFAPAGTSLYVVATGSADTSYGRVVGVAGLHSPSTKGGTSSTMAPGITAGTPTADFAGPDEFHRPELYSSSLADTPFYCVSGAPRDLFVPLENEITSDSDPFENSWKHYLTQAKTAAQRADDLGNQLIALGTQIEFRREAAGEAVAAICGDPVDLTHTEFDSDGDPLPYGADVSLRSCISEKKVDVVFFGEDPTTDADRTTAVQNLLRCASDGSSNPLCKKTSYTTDALHLTGTTTTPSTTDPMNCDPFSTAFSHLTVGPGLDVDEVGSIAALPPILPDSLKSVAAVLRMVTDENGDFRVTAGLQTIFSSYPEDGVNDIWPACVATPGKCNVFKKYPQARIANAVLRACPYEGTFTGIPVDLGACDGGAPDPVRAELNEIRWRLEGVVWQIGVMAGGVPGGIIDTYVPAANFGAGGWGLPATTPVSTAYLPGSTFDGSGKFSSGHPEAISTLGVAKPLTANWMSLGGTFLANEADPTFASVFGGGDTSKFVLIHATNSGYQADFGNLLRVLGDFESPPNPDEWHHSMPPNLIQEIFKTGSGALCGFGTRAAPDTLSRVLLWSANDQWFGKDDTVIDAAGHVVWGGDPLYTDSVGTPRKPFAPWSVADVGDFTLGSGLSPVYASNASNVDFGFDVVDQNNNPHSASSAELIRLRDDENRLLSGDVAGSTPGDRVRWFVNPATDASCSIARRLEQAMAIACAVQMVPVQPEAVPIGTLPMLKDASALPLFDAWLESLASNARARTAQLFLTNIPQRVVDDLAAERVGTGTTKGTHGDKLLEIEAELQNLVSAWRQVSGDLEAIRGAMNAARLAIAAADISKDADLTRLTMEQFQLYAQMAASASGVIGSFGASLAEEPEIAGELSEIPSLQKDLEAKGRNDVATALNALATATNSYWTDLDKSLNGIRSSTARIYELANDRSQLEAQATYEAAKGAGADYVMIDGVVKPLPVNTVLRRQYDATALRYKEALKNAKYSAFLARRSIEQRLGTPLKAIDKPIGTLAAPAEWADEVCSLTGIDYNNLKSNVGPDAGVADDTVIQEFADQYIGDYVAKLEQFVDYFNVEYPSHEGDDIALLSLRQDLLDSTAACTVTSRNRLLFSGRLEKFNPPDSSGNPLSGWRVHACGSTKCLRTFSRLALAAPTTPPTEALRSEATWLHDVAPGPSDSTTGTGDLASAPPSHVSQSVHLEPGTYALSWWDQARDDTGALATATPDPYEVGVYDSKWSIVSGSSFSGPAFVVADAIAGPLWSDRKTVTFTVTDGGTYYVAFAASLRGGKPGSVAIAAVQLESLASTASAPTAYFATDTSLAVPSTMCTGASSAEMRNAFTRSCDATGCFYELARPIVIDTQSLQKGTSHLSGKIAAGNFNYRHVNVAVNLVGTGVHDCGPTPTPECYATGFQEYSLVHEANAVPILTWNGEAYNFDFGRAHVEHAKALAAERYLTLPFSTADSGLLAQPGIEKIELRGRPLDGTYRLRIWESPSLRWDRLDDIQIVLAYHYWSMIEKPTP